jgi:hypothetical protein
MNTWRFVALNVFLVVSCGFNLRVSPNVVACGPNLSCPAGLACHPARGPDGGVVMLCCRDEKCGQGSEMAPNPSPDAPADDQPGPFGTRDVDAEVPEVAVSTADGGADLPVSSPATDAKSDAAVAVPDVLLPPSDSGGCTPGFKLCERNCIPDVGCCANTDCTTGPRGAIGQCDLGRHQCIYPCPDGTHLCDGQCANDKEQATCGLSCSACEIPSGGSATCDGKACGSICPGGTTLCAGKCLAAGEACAGICPPDKHLCGQMCVAADAVTSCGPACESCKAPANATAACTGGTCKFACNADFKLCNDKCIAAGACCNDAECAMGGPTGAAGTCEPTARKCVFACPGNFHECANACVSNALPATCGSSCTPCPPPAGGSATCVGTTCGVSCPQGTTICKGTCLPPDKPCAGVCPDATHDCNGNCVSNLSVNSCGAGCSPCAVPTNGVAACDGSKCSFACLGGFKACVDRCIPVSGCCNDGDCTAAPAGGTGTCQLPAHTCHYSCPTGTHNCDNKCASNNSALTCGSSCMPCPPAGANATATCDGSVCAVSCNATFRNCNNTCIAASACCSDGECSAGVPPNGHGSCTTASRTCGWSCDTNFFKEAGTCINQRQVDCDGNNANPANSDDVVVKVTVQYTTASGWAAPAKCGWMCKSGFTKSADGTTCASASPMYLFSVAPVSGNFGGRGPADAACKNGAPALPINTSVAFLSVSAVDDIRGLPFGKAVPTDRTIFSASGRPLAKDWADLLDGSILATLADAGVLPAGVTAWWSGSEQDGRVAAATCSGWTSTTAPSGGNVGIASATNGQWIASGGNACTSARALLCLGFAK